MRMDEHIKRLIEKYTVEASRASGEDAVEKYQMAYLQAKELDNAFTLRACAANLGAILISLGTKEGAENGVKILEEAFPPEGESDCVSNGDLYFNIGLGYEVLGLFGKAYKSMTQAWEAYRSERDNLPMETAALKKLVQLSQARLKVADAIKWCQKLEESYAQANQLAEGFRAVLQRATLQRKLGDEEELSKVVEECEQQLDKLRQQDAIQVAILVEMSVMLARMKKPLEAKKYLEEASGLLDVEHEWNLEQAVVLQNLGTLCNFLEDWKAALPYHTRAARIYQHYASLPPDPTLPIQPHTALRCQGHVVANHAYAMVRLDDVDEASKLFNNALDMATRSGDVNTVWQMEEALGAIYFRLACQDLNLPSPHDASLKVSLPESRFRYLDKSLEWFKKALRHVATAPGGVASVQDRILEKCAMVTTFKANARLAKPGQVNLQQAFCTQRNPVTTGQTVVEETPTGPGLSTQQDAGQGAMQAVVSKVLRANGEAECSSDDESGEEEDSSDSNYGNDESHNTDQSDPHPHPEDDEQEQIRELYQEQLQSTGAQGGHRSVNADRHTMRAGQLRAPENAEADDETQVKKKVAPSSDQKQTVIVETHRHVSSSAESGSSSSSDDDDDDDEDEDEEESEEEDDEEEESEEGDEETKERCAVPLLPTQSPSVTLLASGTYEKPQSPTEMQINGSHPSRPRPGLHGSINYAEIEFDTRQQSSGELVKESRKPDRLNFFISSSDEDSSKKSGGRTEPVAGPSYNQRNDSDYEPVEVQPTSPPAHTTHRRRETEELDFEMGGETLPRGEEKQKKDSKTCTFM